MKDINLGSSPNINPLSYPTTKCDKCDNIFFRKVTIFKEVPGIAVGAGVDTLDMPIDVYICDKCGAILKRDREILEKVENKESSQQKGTQLIV